MIGKCPKCGIAIFEFINNVPIQPLGNYRSIQLIKENGATIEVPLCIDCHDNWKDEELKGFIAKLDDYVNSNIDHDKPKVSYKNEKFKGINKLGCLKIDDLKNGVHIWR